MIKALPSPDECARLDSASKPCVILAFCKGESATAQNQTSLCHLAGMRWSVCVGGLGFKSKGSGLLETLSPYEAWPGPRATLKTHYLIAEPTKATSTVKHLDCPTSVFRKTTTQRQQSRLGRLVHDNNRRRHQGRQPCIINATYTLQVVDPVRCPSPPRQIAWWQATKRLHKFGGNRRVCKATPGNRHHKHNQTLTG